MKTLTKAELLAEAHQLEAMGGEWLPKHAAAFCNVSTTFLRRSSCPKRFKKLAGVTDKHAVVYVPALVREWNAARTLEDVA